MSEPEPGQLVILMFTTHMLPHDEQDGSTDQTVLYCAGKQKWGTVVKQIMHHLENEELK